MDRFKICTSLIFACLGLLSFSLWAKFARLEEKLNLLTQKTEISNTRGEPISPSPSLIPLTSPLLSPLPSLLPSPSPSSSLAPSILPTTFQPQIIHLGSASSTQTSWTETNIQTQLNSVDYPLTAMAFFEAGLYIVNGEVWVRLKNKTTGAIMSITEIYHNSQTLTWKTSPGFKLHPGNYLYVVEIKSSSGETANLSGARIRITQ